MSDERGGAIAGVMRQRTAIAAILLLWAAYSTLQTLFVLERVSEDGMALWGFFPGLLAVGALLAVGRSRQDCYLIYKPLSWAGFAVLLGVAVFGLSAILPVSVWQGWNWRAALLLAPASGISQELFFRSALLPAMSLLFEGRSTSALLAHAGLFALWHIGPLFVGAPVWAVIAVLLVAFLAGLGWGWQVQRDGSVVWAMAQHSLFWVVGMQFALAG